jgi:hypothetical protein
MRVKTPSDHVSLHDIPARYRVVQLDYGDNVPERLYPLFEQYDRAAYSRWLWQASKTTTYRAKDLTDDAVSHAEEFGITPGNESAFRQQAVAIIRDASEYYARIWAGSKVQLPFWCDTDFAVVDRSLEIRGCFSPPVQEAIENIKAKRLWLKTKEKN